jgi:uncharacterized protein YjbI with pentapeptide repeats
VFCTDDIESAKAFRDRFAKGDGIFEVEVDDTVNTHASNYDALTNTHQGAFIDTNVATVTSYWIDAPAGIREILVGGTVKGDSQNRIVLSHVERFGIDPAFDLRNCDLTNADFGHLTTDTLNLTGSDIRGANLSNVRCRQILGAENHPFKVPHHGAVRDEVLPVSEVILDAVVVTVSKYQNADW